jgi:osmotically inducible protein OsmC
MSPILKVLYTAKTETIGGRETGLSRSSDGLLNVRLSPPGWALFGTNPEQLLAAAWSASFASAIGFAARNRNLQYSGDVTIRAEVDLNLGEEGYFLSSRLFVKLPGLAQEDASELVAEAQRNCPFSKATRGNIDVAFLLV